MNKDFTLISLSQQVLLQKVPLPTWENVIETKPSFLPESKNMGFKTVSICGPATDQQTVNNGAGRMKIRANSFCCFIFKPNKPTE